MKNIIILLLIIPSFSFFKTSNEGLDFMKKRQETLRINTIQSDITIKNISKNGKTQERELKQYIKRKADGGDYYNFLLAYTAPADVKCTAVLTWEYPEKEDDQWLYLPSLRKSRRISAGAKTDRFVGTEITYEDLSSYLSENLGDYAYKLLRKEDKNGSTCNVIEAVPTNAKVNEESGYSKRIIWVSEKENIDIYAEYYDKNGQLQKTVAASNIIMVKDKYRVTDVSVRNVQTGNGTDIHYSNIRINEKLDDSYFTKEYLESL